MVGYGNQGPPINRANLFSVTIDGNAHVAGAYQSGGADFAEFFESESGAKIPVGTPVVFAGPKIRPALLGETPFGVVSATASLIGNSGDEWHGMYERNPDGSFILETQQQTRERPVMVPQERTVQRQVIDYTSSPPQIKLVDEQQRYEVPEMITAVVLNEQGEEIERREVPKVELITEQFTRRKISPLYDPSRPYIPRSARPEWQIVGLLGVVRIVKGSPTNPRWTKIQDEQDYELWLLQ